MWIESGEIMMSFPYDKNVIETWKVFRSRVHNMILSQWEPELLCWHTRATVPAIKHYLDFRKLAKEKHDLDLILDPELTAVDEIFDDTQAELWRVSARLCGSRIVVNHINNSLNDLLPETLDITLENVFKLKNLGINIDFKILEYLMEKEDRALVNLTSSRHLVLGWNGRNQQAILEYLSKFNLTVFLVVDGANKEYSALAEKIIELVPEKQLHLFIWMGSPEVKEFARWNHMIGERDSKLAQIDFETVDVLITPRKLFSSVAAEITKVVSQSIYYCDPKNTAQYWYDV
jgi:hypothetical protein